MKYLLILCLLFAGCDEVEIIVGGPKLAVARERPVANLPLTLRQSNWRKYGEGSCVWATSASLLRWQGRYHTADYLANKYGAGEYADRFAERLELEGIRFVQSTDGDMAFVDWACQTRRGCGCVVQGGRHMIAVVHATDTEIGILDPNDVEHIIYVPRAEFEAEFKASGGWAFAFVYSPTPPLEQP